MQKIRELRGMIYSRFNSESECARALGWSRQRLNNITNGKSEPSIKELNDLSEILHVETQLLFQIFLRQKSPNERRFERKTNTTKNIGA